PIEEEGLAHPRGPDEEIGANPGQRRAELVAGPRCGVLKGQSERPGGAVEEERLTGARRSDEHVRPDRRHRRAETIAGCGGRIAEGPDGVAVDEVRGTAG